MGTWTQKSLQHPSHSDFLWDSKCGSENLLCDQRPGFKSLSNLLVALEMDNACMPCKSLQLCLTLCDPMDCSLPGSSVHGVLQARILEWVARPSSRGLNPRLLCLLHWQAGSLSLVPPGKTLEMDITSLSPSVKWANNGIYFKRGHALSTQ